MKARLTPLVLFALVGASASAQITIDNTITATQLVQNVLLGQGVSASNVTFNGQPGNQVYVNAVSFDGNLANVGVPLGQIGLLGGVFMASGGASTVLGPNNSGSNTIPTNVADQSDVDLNTIANPNATHDAAVLEFDFIPTGDSLKFRYVFASEEYLEWVNSSFNDIFGFFLSGPGINGPYTNNAENIALIPGTNNPVSINNVNLGMNPTYYVDNGDGFSAPWSTDPQCIQFDGMTVILTAWHLVECGVTYHIKLALADAGDSVLDSGVFLEGGSFTSTGQVIPTLTAGNVSANDSTMFEGCGLVPFYFHRMGDTTVTDTINIVIGGTATPGIDYYPALPTQIIFQPGDTILPYPITVPLDPDGIETITITITQNLVCSGSQVVNDYLFYIDQYAPLDIQTTDINGDCGGVYQLAPVVTGGTGLYQFDWNTGATTPAITVNPPVTTTYYFTVYDTCGVQPWSDSVVVTMPVYPPLQMTVTPDTLIDCLGNGDIQVVSALGGNGVYSYGWTLNGTNAGNTALINVPAANPDVIYVATVTDGCGSSVSASVQVGTVPLAPIVITAPDRTVICQGDTTTLMAVQITGGNGVYTYQWMNAQHQVLSLADTLQVGVPHDAGYTITVADQCGYVSDTLAYTFVPNPPPFLLDLTSDTVLCLGDSLTLWARVSGGSGYYTIDWPGNAWSDPQLKVAPEVNESYQVYIYDQCGEVISGEVEVGVEKPVVDIIATNLGEDDWKFDASTQPTFCRNYRWDVGDGTTSRERVVTHSYLDLEEHWVYLKVMTFSGCSGEDSLLLQPPAHIYFPNAFTPDGDGINEMFGPYGIYIEQFEMSIFDRWGQQIFHTDAMDRQWDGKVNGTAAGTGVYVYKFKASGHLFPSIEDFGHVTLLRGSVDDQ